MHASLGLFLSEQSPIPFYVYPADMFMAYDSCDLTRLSISKHAHYSFLLPKLYVDSWRTGPEDAALFFIPAPLDYMARGKCKNDSRVLLHDIVTKVKSMPWYGRRKHFFVANDWMSDKLINILRKRLPQTILVGMENHPFVPNSAYNRDVLISCALGIGYTTEYAVRTPWRFVGIQPLLLNETAKKQYTVSFTGSVKNAKAFPNHNFHRRSIFCVRKDINFSFPVFITANVFEDDCAMVECPRGNYDRCIKQLTIVESIRVMETSNFTLCFEGDTRGSDRWQNSMSAGAIPIGVGKSVEEVVGWLPFQDIIPWRDIVVFINISRCLVNPVEAIDSVISSINATEIERKRSLIRRFRSDYDWAGDNTRYARNILHAVDKLNCSGTRHNV
jgi:hypothetical protein